VSATLICPSCKAHTHMLWCFAWCQLCWYTVCGGDLASDWSLSVAPSVVLSAALDTEETA
jgi:hypothetical protein